MQIIQSLTETRNKTLTYFQLPEDDLAKTYAPGKWTVKQLLVHLTDAETVLYERIRRVIAEPKQVIWAFDQDLWNENLQYPTYPLELSKNVFASVRDSIIYLAEKHYVLDGHKEYVHSEVGIRTLKDEFDKVAWHNQGHLNQIEMALSKM